MPTYTIAGKKVTSAEPLTDEELESLYDEFSGVKPAAKPAAPAAKPGFAERPVMMRPDEYGERFGAEPEVGPSIREVKEKGTSVGLGVPGGLLDIFTGILGLGGESKATQELREMEKKLAARAPSEAGYQAGKVIPQVVPALTTAKAVSKIPVASRAAQAALQAAGQAGQAAVVTPSAVEGEEDRGMFGLGPRATAAVLEGTLGLAGEAAGPVLRGVVSAPGKAADFARSVRESMAGRIRGVPTTPVTEEEKAALAISKGRDVTPDETDLATAERAAAERRAELDRIKIAEGEAGVIRERQRQALLAQKKAAKEAEIKALETVELTPTRGKQELGKRLRDVVTSARKKYLDAREQAIGKYESGDEVPVFTAAKEMEAAGEFISRTDEFKNLVKFLRERGVGRVGKSELDREEIKAFKNVLRDVTPKQRVIEEVVDEAGNVTKRRVSEPVDITFEKLVKLRRRIAAGDPGVAETGFKAITGDTRDKLLEKIDGVLDDFSPGYLDYKKAYAEASEPLDFLKVNSVGKKAATFQKFSQEEFQANPEAVLDALLNNPSKTNADNLLKFVGNENKDEIEQVVLEALVNKAGGKSAGYTKVLEKYDDFLEAFPTAKARLQEEAGAFEKATGPARAEFEKATAGLEGIKLAKADARNLERIARAEFNKADAVRVAANERVKALNQLDEDTLIAVSEAANKIPLGTSLGLAQATALAAMAGGAGALMNDSPVLGILGIAAGGLGRKVAKNAFAKKRKEVSDRIEEQLRKIITDRSGGRAASIQTRIDNEAGIMDAQRLANQALRNLGIKPGTGAVTANVLYKAFATDKDAGSESVEPSQAEGEEGVVESESGEPESAVDGESYNLDSIISQRGAEDLAPIIKSIYEQESSSGQAKNLDRENYAGAKGPMQVIRTTFDNMKDAGMLPEDYSFDNQSHLAEAGVVLIQDLAKRYGNDPAKIAAAYYGGPKAVTASGIRRDQRDLKNPKAPTVGQYADQVLARLMPTAEAKGMAEGGAVDAERQRVISEIRKTPWFSNFVRRHGEEPDLSENANYDYFTAWISGARPDKTDHWPSYTANGKILKKEGHPTLWKTRFMDATGIDPDSLGIKNEQEGQAYIQRQRVKKARGGSIYTPAEEVLLRRYASR
jgi:hypothetical protein